MRAEIGCRDDELSVDWWTANSDDHQSELIDQQEGIVNGSTRTRRSSKAIKEIVKSLRRRSTRTTRGSGNWLARSSRHGCRNCQ